MDLRLSGDETRWSGLLSGDIRDKGTGTALAHGQHVRHYLPVEPDTKVMIYQAKVSWNGVATLYGDELTHCVCLPPDHAMDLTKVKEVCSGMGCMGIAASYLGLHCVAAMDWNPKIAEHLRENHHEGVLVGNVNVIEDRFRLHMTGGPIRGTLMRGFPCQPLSSQGDRRGDKDDRTQPFYNTLRLAWEQQMGAVILECVPMALEASHVQEALQRFAWSMNMTLQQRVLHLANCWPCSRTRWWCIITFREYQIEVFPDLPRTEPPPVVGDLLSEWPSWPPEIEAQVRLTAQEYQLYMNPMFGKDQRHLRLDKASPCLLHSYGSILEACPCGCRSYPLSLNRLERDGARGFFVQSSVDQRMRYLTAQEAALLLTLPAGIKYATEKLGLALLGQCAAPAQALWALSHLLRGAGLLAEPDRHLRLWLMGVLRSFSSVVRFPQMSLHAELALCDTDDMIKHNIQLGGVTTIKELMEAERRLAGHGTSVQVGDALGTLQSSATLHHAAISGEYVIVHKAKRQCRSLAHQTIQVSVWENDSVQSFEAMAGTLLFEFFLGLGIEVLPGSMVDDQGHVWAGDERPLQNVNIIEFKYRANGFDPSFGLVGDFGLSDTCIDQVARKLLRGMGVTTMHWMPAAMATQWSECNFDCRQLDHWLLSALHGHLLCCCAIESHWVLMDINFKDQILHIQIMDGTTRAHHWAMEMAVNFKKILAVRTCCIHRRTIYEQQYGFTCGTIALLHLGYLIGIWTLTSSPPELDWHCQLLLAFPEPWLLRAGALGDLSQEEKEVVWRLRDILQQRGVPEHLTEERALIGLSKVGLHKLKGALDAKDVWGQLKVLGSAPKVNFLWIKPAELEEQIKKRAQSKFKVNSSHKKASKNKSSGSQPMVVDPLDLQLIEGTFMAGDDAPMNQLKISEVGANRCGIAFGQLSDVQPYLQGTESLTLGGLGILTTTPIPVVAQGLLPVTNLRFPAIFIPTGEAILIEGSLIQLGDQTIHRVENPNRIQIDEPQTVVLKITVFKDEWPHSWDTFTISPVKAILNQFPAFVLCKGISCGDGCQKYHPPVDTELGSVIADVWNRFWLSLRGKRMPAAEADIFQVYFRTPQVCMSSLHWLSGNAGLYVEPRSVDGRSTDPSLAVIWLPGSNLTEAMHKQKTIEKTLPVTRFGSKYGVRVLIKDEAQIRAKMGAEESQPRILVQQIYEMRPLPHGTTRKGLTQMLSELGWAAKPVQPGRADASGMSWKVGAEAPPPAPIVQTSMGDVTISLQKQVITDSPIQRVFGSTRTQAHLRRKARKEDNKENIKPPQAPDTGADPWLQADPWAKWPQRSGSHDGDVQMQVVPKLESIEEKLRGEISNVVAEATDSRFAKLEVDLAEMRHQQGKFESWCHDAGQAQQHMQAQLGQLAATVSEHSAELSDMGKEIKSGFQNIEALLVKRSRTE